uniref:Uncharacterized protein n=1 Tax=Setaria viridis TaxID=4556 RepID=A0A4U6UKT2_SETVI|nr:hypothetical protein SEVIR_5G324800v2 [Setaria viridis]
MPPLTPSTGSPSRERSSAPKTKRFVRRQRIHQNTTVHVPPCDGHGRCWGLLPALVHQRRCPVCRGVAVAQPNSKTEKGEESPCRCGASKSGTEEGAEPSCLVATPVNKNLHCHVNKNLGIESFF